MEVPNKEESGRGTGNAPEAAPAGPAAVFFPGGHGGCREAGATPAPINTPARLALRTTISSNK